MSTKEERLLRGNTAAQSCAELYRRKYGVVLIPGTPQEDFKGKDFLEPVSMRNVDVKNNYMSYIFQYSVSSGRISAPNPYQKGCITDLIFVYDERVDPRSFAEYTMEEYWSRFFKDKEDVPAIKEFIAGLCGYKKSYLDYIKNADTLVEKLYGWIKPDVQVIRNDRDLYDDSKIYLKVK